MIGKLVGGKAGAALYSIYDIVNLVLFKAYRSLLVNLAYVDGYSQQEVTVAGEQLPLSRVYKTDFLNDLTKFVGDGRGGTPDNAD